MSDGMAAVFMTLAETEPGPDAMVVRFDDDVAEALVRAFRAQRWATADNFQGGLDVVVAPDLMVTTGVTGWGYASGSVLEVETWEPVEDIDGPSWSEHYNGDDGSTPEVLAGRAVDAIQDWMERYRKAHFPTVRFDDEPDEELAWGIARREDGELVLAYETSEYTPSEGVAWANHRRWYSFDEADEHLQETR